ncbi:uncharacterized protein LOC121835367 [Ixodes scapularis]|uniref:uncharacterized protein LOC121835367 n=1 Tax=Ixodes scapularis TaxID=6945 RepID=UPI0011619C4D|nr:uncharacterized protein LOC121835367 [Ixodes scapularis]
MNHRIRYLLVTATWAILTAGNATPLSNVNEPPGNLTLNRSPRGLSPQQVMEERLTSCLLDDGFTNVNCHIENSSVRCFSGGFDSTPIGTVVATALGVAAGAICVAAIGCCFWTMNGKRNEKAAAAQKSTPSSKVPAAKGHPSVKFFNPLTASVNIGTGFYRL